MYDGENESALHTLVAHMHIGFVFAEYFMWWSVVGCVVVWHVFCSNLCVQCINILYVCGIVGSSSSTQGGNCS